MEREIKDIDALNTFIPHDNRESIPKDYKFISFHCIWGEVQWQKKSKISYLYLPHKSRHIKNIFMRGINWTFVIDFPVGKSKWNGRDSSIYRKCKLTWTDMQNYYTQI